MAEFIYFHFFFEEKLAAGAKKFDLLADGNKNMKTFPHQGAFSQYFDFSHR